MICNAASIPAIVLAAGQSTRMGAPKALLPDRDGRPFVVRVVTTLASADINDIVVVVGSQHGAIREALEAASVSAALIENPDPSRGQLSSLQAALAVMDRPGVEAALVTLVDVPLVTSRTVSAIVNAYCDSRSVESGCGPSVPRSAFPVPRSTGVPRWMIVRPEKGGRHGHPVLFDRALFSALRHADVSAGAKPVMHAHAGQILDVAIDDEGAFQDIDTPEEYERLIGSPEPK